MAGTSLSGLRGGRELDRIVALRGRPAMIVSDNGKELTSHAMRRWQQARGVAWHDIATAQPASPPLKAPEPRPSLPPPGPLTNCTVFGHVPTSDLLRQKISGRDAPPCLATLT